MNDSVLVGYMRISKADGSQLVDLQKDALLSAGVDKNRLYSDAQSGSRHDNRPGLANCLKALQSGNTLVVWKLDRLGRNLKDLINIDRAAVMALCRAEDERGLHGLGEFPRLLSDRRLLLFRKLCRKQVVFGAHQERKRVFIHAAHLSVPLLDVLQALLV